MDRTILHCDCNCFFASVEQVRDPKLKNVPMAVAGDPKRRAGIILAKNELAKRYNVQTAEAIWQAKQKCPKLVIVPPHMDLYKQYSRSCNEIYNRYTDLVEPFGIDESWLDTTASTALFGDGETIANRIRTEIKKELGITVSIGVSFNKIFAKLGSDQAAPDSITVISREHGRKVVFPLPVGALLFVGKVARKELEKLGILTIRDLAKFDREILIDHIGSAGARLHDYANGRDISPVNPIREQEKSIGRGTTFPKDITDFDELSHIIKKLAQDVGFRMRRKNLKASVIQVSIKSPDLRSIQRQKKLDQPTNLTIDIIDHAKALARANVPKGKPVRAITVTASKLSQTGSQLGLFYDEKKERLQETIDALNMKYGKDMLE